MYDEIKSTFKKRPYACAFLLLRFVIDIIVLAMLLWCFFGNEPTADNDVNATVSNIKQDIGTARSEVNKSLDQVQQAQSGISRATESIRESRERASSMSSTTNECQQLIDECISDNKRAREILQQVGEANSSPASNK